MLPFNSRGHLTLGVEIELQLIDKETLDLKSVAPRIFERTAHTPKIKPESFDSVVEINTGICQNAQEAEADLRATLEILQDATQRENVVLAATGTHPFARYLDQKLYSSERYNQLIDRNQWITRRMMIFGLHVHLGMRDGDTCIRFNNFLLHFIPHLLAMTASSPFWQGDDTGLASCRSTIFESCPTAGHPYRVKDWNEFCDLCDKLITSKAILSYKDLWWDIRPSPDFGTLELRICDGLATISEAVAVVAFIHALAHWFEKHGDYNVEMEAPYMWMIRENKWRATRHGLNMDMIHGVDASLIGIREDIAAWVQRTEPVAEALGYAPYYAVLRRSLDQGPSYLRQRQIFQNTGSLKDVTRHNIEEFTRDMPVY